jgi:hypothetical protein
MPGDAAIGFHDTVDAMARPEPTYTSAVAGNDVVGDFVGVQDEVTALVLQEVFEHDRVFNVVRE